MKELITLSRREVQRMQVLEQVKKGVLSLKAAGRRSVGQLTPASFTDA